MGHEQRDSQLGASPRRDVGVWSFRGPGAGSSSIGQCRRSRSRRRPAPGTHRLSRDGRTPRSSRCPATADHGSLRRRFGARPHASVADRRGATVHRLGRAGGLSATQAGRPNRADRFGGGQELRVPVVVRGQGQPALLSFRRDVVAVLNVSGCNAGACHGAPSGKNGFKLSLRGFDPAADYAQLTRDQSGRRVNRAEPESSLFLMKGQGLIPHEGGQKLAPRGELAALLRDWVVEGVRDDPADVPAVSSIEIRPGPRIITAPARQQQLAVIAHFADGSDRDVTRLTAFSSSDEEVAKVNSKGLVEFNRTGEAAVLCRYLETLLPVRLAFIDPDSSQPWPNPPAYNVVDRHIFAKMKQLGLAPAGLSSDSEFIRRASLDLCGILPTPQEVRSFLADQRSEKRPRLIDHLLERPEYVDFWTLKWADVLGNNRRSLQAKGAYAFHQWLRDHVARNSPVDVMVRQSSRPAEAPSSTRRRISSATTGSPRTRRTLPRTPPSSSWASGSVRPLPQPPVREVDPAGLLRAGRVFCPRQLVTGFLEPTDRPIQHRSTGYQRRPERRGDSSPYRQDHRGQVSRRGQTGHSTRD